MRMNKTSICFLMMFISIFLSGAITGCQNESSDVLSRKLIESQAPSASSNSVISESNSSATSDPIFNSSGAKSEAIQQSSSYSQSGDVVNVSSNKTPQAESFVFPKLVGDNMVLQRNASIKIWGSYPKEGKITVTLNGKSFYGNCKKGNFEVLVNTGNAGGPYALTVASTTDKKVINNVLVGDVYICAGQSNMLMQVGALKDKTLRNTPVTNKIRLFHVQVNPSQTPLEDCASSYDLWTECTPVGYLDNFSAVGFVFGKTLYEKYKIPIGLIESCEGDTIVASWLPVKDAATIEKNYQSNDSLQRRIASRLYNGMIHPLRKYCVKGVLWYQGENQNYKYQEWLTLMINAWRREFNNQKMTFTIVQLPRWCGDYEGTWFSVRQQQKSVATTVPNCTYSVNLDCGEYYQIHPDDKEVVGIRAAQATMTAFYGEKGYKRSPYYKSHIVSGNKVSITFSNVDKGLQFKTEQNAGEKDWKVVYEGTGFEIKDDAGIYHSATAKLEGNTLVLTSEVTNPKGIRYGYKGAINFPYISLFDKNGLPAEQFEIVF